jgi:hypothetical protein
VRGEEKKGDVAEAVAAGCSMKVSGLRGDSEPYTEAASAEAGSPSEPEAEEEDEEEEEEEAAMLVADSDAMTL